MKIKFNKKKIFALTLASSLFLCRTVAYMGNVYAQEIDENVNTDKTISVDDGVNETTYMLNSEQLNNLNITRTVYLFNEPGDIQAKLNVMLRNGPGVENAKYDKIHGSHLVKAYGISDNGWYLVSYNGVLGFAHSNYFVNKTLTADAMDFVRNIQQQVVLEEEITIESESVVEELQEVQSVYDVYPNVQPLEGVMYANKNVFFRMAPDYNAKDYGLIKVGKEVKLLGFENGWYLVEYNGKIGYVYSYYVSYDKESKYRDDFLDVVYITYDTPLLDSDSDTASAKYFFNRYEVCEVLGVNYEWYYVRYEDMYGYIRRDCTSKIGDKAVVVDIDNQRLTLYDNNRIVVETDVVTGTLGVYDTPTGMYYIKNKVTNISLTSEKYGYNQPVDYWMPFYDGIGLHDADWRSKFGGDIYIKDGSHGCVNIPPKYADDVFDNVDYKTKVIVHK